ncbi:MAG: glycosyltransferase family 4 protein, partial [Planctomycetota bacterium]
WKEQFGRMLVEAFACGVPVIGSDSGEIPYVIGDAGIVSPEGKVEPLAAALARLITDAALRQTYREAGLARAASRYSWPQVARNAIDFFDSLVDGRATATPTGGASA